MRYDAFISYRHGELDGLVAEKLHRMLETYRIPNAIAKKVGKNKLSRVFRDREELPTSSNLSDSINDALENSSFLLLICSRRTCGSQWVMREVERFGELHGKDRIVTLLIDGEPDESFPPGLREREVGGETIFVEPLAADIRAETWAGSLKLLKEEKLRLLAPILGCAFDDLRRRHRRRRIQRITFAVGSAFTFTFSFGAFSTYQYIQIDRQMQLKLENQSYVLAEYSANELAEGDPETAQLLALSALPKDLSNPNRPLVPAAERALSDALGVYDVADGFKPHKAISLPAAPGKVILSPDEKYAAAIYPFELAIFQTENGIAAAKLPTTRSALAGVEFLSGNTAVFAGENGIEAYDIAQGISLWQGRPATAISVSEDKTVIAAVFKDEGAATLYAPDGRELGRIDFAGKAMRMPTDDSFLNPCDTLFALSGDGGKLAVSFSDGSLSVFDTRTAKETALYPAGNAIYFAGGFQGNALSFSVVENEPYYSGYFAYDLNTNEKIAQYDSDSSRFLPFAGQGGLYFAYENQIMSVDSKTGAVSHIASAGGRVETFKKSGDAFIICESGGPYRFIGGGARVYQSSYACNFADIGSRYALSGSYDSKTMRILQRTNRSGTEVLPYDSAYNFSEVKINPTQNRAVFYSYNGLRLCDLGGNIIAETAFPDPLNVLDTEYDKANGNVIVLYKNALRLYSGLDGSLMLEAQGKPGAKSVIYTDFGVSVLEAGGTAVLYDTATGHAAASVQAGASADCALPIGGGLLSSEGGHIFFDGRDIGAGELIGAGFIGEESFAFAVSDGSVGKVFTVKNGAPEERFSFEARGRAEAYFCGGYAFISPTHGDAAAYTLEGARVCSFTENGYMAEVGIMGEYIVAGYASSSSQRYSYLLNRATLETQAYLPGFLGELDAMTLVLDDGAGSLRAEKLRGTEELIRMAQERLDGRILSPEEEKKFKAG